ncbi:hypothetical protein TJA_20750 [Thermus sp. LT1-2-5]
MPLFLLRASPPAGLVGFLLLALLHWGRVEGKGILGYFRASTVLLMPFVLHPEAISPFLQAFARGFALPAGLALSIWLVLLLLSLREQHPVVLWGDTLALVFLSAFAHPYAALAGYFLLVHSVDSLRLVGVRGKEWLGVYVATLAALALALPLLPLFQDPLATYMALLFALTLPHALTLEAWLRRSPPPGRWPAPGR